MKALLGVPDDVHFVCVVTIGHSSPQGDDEATTSRLSRSRVPLGELVRRI